MTNTVEAAGGDASAPGGGAFESRGETPLETAGPAAHAPRRVSRFEAARK